MSRRHHVTRFAFVLCLCSALPAAAQQRAHEHGVGRLDVAVDGGTVELLLEAPGDNIVGFEHAARSAQERTAARTAEQRLRQGATLFALPAAAGCTLRSARVQAPAAGAEAAGHTHDGHGHDKPGKGEHDHGHDDHHAEWTASYVFACRTPAALDALDAAGLFRTFPNTRALRVQVVGPAGQSGRTLTPKAARIALRGR